MSVCCMRCTIGEESLTWIRVGIWKGCGKDIERMIPECRGKRLAYLGPTRDPVMDSLENRRHDSVGAIGSSSCVCVRGPTSSV